MMYLCFNSLTSLLISRSTIWTEMISEETWCRFIFCRVILDLIFGINKDRNGDTSRAL